VQGEFILIIVISFGNTGIKESFVASNSRHFDGCIASRAPIGPIRSSLILSARSQQDFFLRVKDTTTTHTPSSKCATTNRPVMLEHVHVLVALVKEKMRRNNH
jgi:hypothetical protein